MRGLIYFLVTAISTVTYSQSQQFNRVYDFNGTFEQNANITTVNSGYIVNGISATNSKFSGLLVHLATNGDTINSKIYNIFGLSTVGGYFENTIVLQDRITVASWLYDSTNIAHAYVAQFSISGEMLWVDSLGGSANFTSLVKIDDGYLIGGIQRTIESQEQFLACKYSNTGELLWKKHYGQFDKNENCYTISQCADGGFVLGGNRYMGTSSNPYILKIDSQGNELWEKEFQLSDYDDYPIRVFIEKSGDIYLAAGAVEAKLSNQFSLRRAWFCKLDAFGNQIWEKKLGLSSISNGPCSILSRRNGNILYLFSSQFSGDSLGARIARIYELDKAGNEIKNIIATYDSNNKNLESIPLSIDTTLDNGFIIGGHVTDLSQDLWVVKFDSHGCYDSTYNCVVGIQDPRQQLQTLKIFPNPAQAQISVLGHGNFIVFNSLGQQIPVPSHVSENTTTFNIQHLPKGIYFIRSEGEDEVYIGKFVKE